MFANAVCCHNKVTDCDAPVSVRTSVNGSFTPHPARRRSTDGRRYATRRAVQCRAVSDPTAKSERTLKICGFFYEVFEIITTFLCFAAATTIRHFVLVIVYGCVLTII